MQRAFPRLLLNADQEGPSDLPHQVLTFFHPRLWFGTGTSYARAMILLSKLITSCSSSCTRLTPLPSLPRLTIAVFRKVISLFPKKYSKRRSAVHTLFCCKVYDRKPFIVDPREGTEINRSLRKSQDIQTS